MEDITSLLLFYVPLGVVGVWRWSSWLLRRIIGWFYVPCKHDYSTTVSVITPVYNENPTVFRMALESWKANLPEEIIAVIDSSDKNSIAEFQTFSKNFPGARLIITEKPGKRPALADGIRAASGEIVALVDSDTIWSDSVVKEGLRPFFDQKVAGVATRQNVLNPKSVAQNIFDIQLDLRFSDDMMPAAVMGNAFTVLSGRTALYRRSVVLPMLDALVNEKFWGKQCIGGDDKRLTYLVEAAGWKTAYQHTAQVYTPGSPDMATLFKQRMRWARNTWRADLRAMRQGWVWRNKFLSFILVDRVISNFTLLLSLSYFLVTLYLQLWIPAAILFAWWLVSRGIRITPNLARRPGNIKIIPVYITTNFGMAIVRLYALLTLNRQDWLTRGVKKRGINFGLILARIGTAGILALIILAVYNYRFKI